jgi:cytochrome c oxidase subunit 4
MTAGLIWRCWLALVILLALTTAFAFVPAGSANILVALAIASAKALIVLIYYMERPASTPMSRAEAAAALFWMLIMIALTGSDYFHRTDQHVPVDEVRAAPL